MDVQMNDINDTSQNFSRQFITSFQQIMTSVQVVGFLIKRFNIEIWKTDGMHKKLPIHTLILGIKLNYFTSTKFDVPASHTHIPCVILKDI